VIPIADRYSAYAPFYDLMSGEYPVYRAGRRLGIEMMDLHAGAQVVDIGCGTGLNFALLQRKIGASGTIVGIDRSSGMLARARRRASRNGWTNVILLEADATVMSPSDVGARIVAEGGSSLSDAVLATYSLSLMGEWELAWNNMVSLGAPAAVLGVVDMQEPTGAFTAMAPLARAACWLGGADISAHPWLAVERDCTDVRAASARGGHLQVRVGRSPRLGTDGRPSRSAVEDPSHPVD
jgi:demethylmenaquinone methyltransferase/2-methoxy-6-polyprenyl-1,4-benzoquinol methylase